MANTDLKKVAEKSLKNGENFAWNLFNKIRKFFEKLFKKG